MLSGADVNVVRKPIAGMCTGQTERFRDALGRAAGRARGLAYSSRTLPKDSSAARGYLTRRMSSRGNQNEGADVIGEVDITDAAQHQQSNKQAP